MYVNLATSFGFWLSLENVYLHFKTEESMIATGVASHKKETWVLNQ